MSLTQQIEMILEELMAPKKLFLLNLNIHQSATRSKISVVVDGDDGVNIDDCALISRKLGEILEEKDLIKTQYLLEVGSPGADHPLTLQRQYPKHIGRKLHVLLANEVIKNGKLLEVYEDRIVLDEEVAEKKEKGKKQKVTIQRVAIPFVDIKKSNVLISFK